MPRNAHIRHIPAKLSSCRKGNELVNSQLPAATDLLRMRDLCRTLFDQIMKIIKIKKTNKIKFNLKFKEFFVYLKLRRKKLNLMSSFFMLLPQVNPNLKADNATKKEKHSWAKRKFALSST